MASQMHIIAFRSSCYWPGDCRLVLKPFTILQVIHQGCNISSHDFTTLHCPQARNQEKMQAERLCKHISNSSVVQSALDMSLNISRSACRTSIVSVLSCGMTSPILVLIPIANLSYHLDLLGHNAVIYLPLWVVNDNI